MWSPAPPAHFGDLYHSSYNGIFPYFRGGARRRALSNGVQLGRGRRALSNGMIAA